MRLQTARAGAYPWLADGRPLLRSALLAFALAAVACDDTETGSAEPDLPAVPDPTRVPAQAPFAQHSFSYAAGSILPNHVTQAELDQAASAFYDVWKPRYVVADCGPGRYVVQGAQREAKTVSESIGYGMIVSAFMAGHDPEAKAVFDGLYFFFRDHPIRSSRYLMGWQATSCDSYEASSATDGDLDVAFGLLLADRQWGSCHGIDYLDQARRVLDAISLIEFDTTKSYPLLGSWALPSTAQHAATRSSDLMVDHYRAFAAVHEPEMWLDATSFAYDLIESFQNRHSPDTGLVSDFLQSPGPLAQPAPPGFLESERDGAYNYNACRNPLRYGTDFLVSGSERARGIVQKTNDWLSAATGGDPANIRAGYQLDGTPLVSYAGLPFVAPFAVGAMVDSKNQAWLNALWDTVVASEPEGYYGDVLKMLSLIVLSGNWWAPEQKPSACP